MDKSQAIEVLELEKQQILAQLHSLDLTILTLKQSLNMPNIVSLGKVNNQNNGTSYSSPTLKYNGYKKAKSNKEKAVIIIRQEARFLHMRELISIASALEPDVDPKQIKKQTSQAIYALKHDGSLIDIKVGKSNMNTFWGSKAWLNEDGTPKGENMYDLSQLTSNNKTERIEI